MGRHAASATVYVSGHLVYLDDLGVGATGGQFYFWHGPGKRWRIEDSDHQVVYTQSGDGVAHSRNVDGVMTRMAGDIRMPLTYAAFRPFDVIAPDSLIYRMTTSMRVVEAPVQVHYDGRLSWKTSLDAHGDLVEATIDNATGVLVQMATQGVAPITVQDLREHDDLPESTFEPVLTAGRPRDVELPSSAEILAAARPRLEILEAISTAVERRDTMLDIVSRAPTPEHARSALRDEFGFTHNGADAVLAMQIRRLSVVERESITSERDELRQQIIENQE